MINLEVFFKNHFDTKEISDNNLKLFSEVHLQRIIANNPGCIYSTRITATTTAYNNYFGAISNEDIKVALQQGLTITMNNAMGDFVKTTQQKEGIVKGTWGKDSEEYQEFFPHGLDEYDQIDLGTAELLMNRMVAASTAHVADLGAPFVTLFTDLRTTFIDARTAQPAVMGQVEGLKSTAEINRNVLEVELMINLLIIASNNVGHPEMMPDYFDQSIIRRPGDSDEGENEVLEGDLLMGEAKALETTGITFTDTTPLQLEATATTVRYYFLQIKNGFPGPTDPFVDVTAGGNIPKTAVDLGFNATRVHLHAQNVGMVPGSYMVTIGL